MERLKPIAGLTVAALALVLAAPSIAPAALRPGEILVSDPGEGSPEIVRIDPASGKQTVLSSNTQAVNALSQFLLLPTGIAISPSGRVFVADYEGAGGSGAVIEIDPDTGKQTLVSSNSQPVNASSQHFVDPSGIGLMPDGRIVVVDRSAFGLGGLIAVNPTSGKQSVLSSNLQPVNASSGYFSDPRGGNIVFSDRGQIVVGDSSAFPGPGGGLISVDPRTGKQSELSSNNQAVNSSSQHYGGPNGVVRDQAGLLFVSDQFAFGPPPGQGGVISVNQLTGKQTKVAGKDTPGNSSDLFQGPTDIAIARDDRLLLAMSDGITNSGCGDGEGCGGIVAIDPKTGRATLISSNAQPLNAGDPHFSDPAKLAVVPPRCGGRRATIAGSSLAEAIRGTPRADVIAGGNGTDRIGGLAGNDRVCAGKGGDRVRGGRGRDRLRGEAGRDRLLGGAGRDVLIGGGGRDRLRGGPGRDRQRQ